MEVDDFVADTGGTQAVYVKDLVEEIRSSIGITGVMLDVETETGRSFKYIQTPGIVTSGAKRRASRLFSQIDEAKKTGRFTTRQNSLAKVDLGEQRAIAIRRQLEQKLFLEENTSPSDLAVLSSDGGVVQLGEQVGVKVLGSRVSHSVVDRHGAVDVFPMTKTADSVKEAKKRARQRRRKLKFVQGEEILRDDLKRFPPVHRMLPIRLLRKFDAEQPDLAQRRRARPKALIVDCNLVHLASCKIVFEKYFEVVQCVSTADQAIDLLDHIVFDLVLVAPDLPGELSGLDLVDAIRHVEQKSQHTFRSLVIAVLSTEQARNQTLLDACFCTGMDRFLQKPAIIYVHLLCDLLMGGTSSDAFRRLALETNWVSHYEEIQHILADDHMTRAVMALVAAEGTEEVEQKKVATLMETDEEREQVEGLHERQRKEELSRIVNATTQMKRRILELEYEVDVLREEKARRANVESRNLTTLLALESRLKEAEKEIHEKSREAQQFRCKAEEYRIDLKNLLDNGSVNSEMVAEAKRQVVRFRRMMEACERSAMEQLDISNQRSWNNYYGEADHRSHFEIGQYVPRFATDASASWYRKELNTLMKTVGTSMLDFGRAIDDLRSKVFRFVDAEKPDLESVINVVRDQIATITKKVNSHTGSIRYAVDDASANILLREIHFWKYLEDDEPKLREELHMVNEYMDQQRLRLYDRSSEAQTDTFVWDKQTTRELSHITAQMMEVSAPDPGAALAMEDTAPYLPDGSYQPQSHAAFELFQLPVHMQTAIASSPTLQALLPLLPVVREASFISERSRRVAFAAAFDRVEELEKQRTGTLRQREKQLSSLSQRMQHALDLKPGDCGLQADASIEETLEALTSAAIKKVDACKTSAVELVSRASSAKPLPAASSSATAMTPHHLSDSINGGRVNDAIHDKTATPRSSNRAPSIAPSTSSNKSRQPGSPQAGRGQSVLQKSLATPVHAKPKGSSPSTAGLAPTSSEPRPSPTPSPAPSSHHSVQQQPVRPVRKGSDQPAVQSLSSVPASEAHDHGEKIKPPLPDITPTYQRSPAQSSNLDSPKMDKDSFAVSNIMLDTSPLAAELQLQPRGSTSDGSVSITVPELPLAYQRLESTALTDPSTAMSVVHDIQRETSLDLMESVHSQGARPLSILTHAATLQKLQSIAGVAEQLLQKLSGADVMNAEIENRAHIVHAERQDESAIAVMRRLEELERLDRLSTMDEASAAYIAVMAEALSTFREMFQRGEMSRRAIQSQLTELRVLVEAAFHQPSLSESMLSGSITAVPTVSDPAPADVSAQQTVTFDEETPVSASGKRSPRKPKAPTAQRMTPAETLTAHGSILPEGTVLPETIKLPPGTVLPEGLVFPNGFYVEVGTTIAHGTVLPGGTILEKGSVVPSGTVLTSGSSLPRGTVITSGTVISSGSVFPEGTSLPHGTVLPKGVRIPPGTVIPVGSVVRVPPEGINHRMPPVNRKRPVHGHEDDTDVHESPTITYTSGSFRRTPSHPKKQNEDSTKRTMRSDDSLVDDDHFLPVLSQVSQRSAGVFQSRSGFTSQGRVFTNMVDEARPAMSTIQVTSLYTPAAKPTDGFLLPNKANKDAGRVIDESFSRYSMGQHPSQGAEGGDTATFQLGTLPHSHAPQAVACHSPVPFAGEAGGVKHATSAPEGAFIGRHSLEPKRPLHMERHRPNPLLLEQSIVGSKIAGQGSTTVGTISQAVYGDGSSAKVQSSSTFVASVSPQRRTGSPQRSSHTSKGKDGRNRHELLVSLMS